MKEDLGYSFQYDSKNLDAFRLDLFSGAFDLTMLTISIITLMLGVALYLSLPHIIGRFVIRNMKRQKERSMERITELRMMKEIQDELEKEIEKDMLNEGLRAA